MLLSLRLLLIAPLLVCLSVQTAMAGTEPLFSLSASLRLFWGLLIVLGVLLIVYALVKKKLSFLSGGSGKSVITIVEMRHLMPKKSVCLIKVRDQEFLIGLGNDQINLIAAIHPAPPDTIKPPDTNDFATALTVAASTGNP
ncbi:MAG: flagellar biosynthetic protein [Desulfobulbaceae bacterium]|jgi:flagellar protein FliO/FliZ|nr:MAG: flagellar biosynthetic protein [Desulfobulbaceae bacterium]